MLRGKKIIQVGGGADVKVKAYKDNITPATYQF